MPNNPSSVISPVLSLLFPMSIFLRTEICKEKKLLGIKARMSFNNHNPAVLWQRFMPQKKAIKNQVDSVLYSLEVYPDGFFESFDRKNEFDKWAAVEVSDFFDVPEGMEQLVIPKGLYAVFLHKGTNTEAAKTYDYIFREWLPGSKYEVDNRPHFAVMGEKYKKDDSSSEEEIYIPVTPTQ